MLSKRKKRIAALFTAVVLSVTAAFSLPDNIRAEEVTATNSDADAEATTEEGLQEDGIAVQDIGDTGETVYIHSRYWDGWVIADYVNVTATDYTPSAWCTRSERCIWTRDRSLLHAVNEIFGTV